MTKKGFTNCAKCGREMYMPKFANQEQLDELGRALINDEPIICPRCAVTATKGKHYPSEAK